MLFCHMFLLKEKKELKREMEIVLGATGYRRPVGLWEDHLTLLTGHVHISKVALRMFDLGQIYWVYTKQNPLKRSGPSSFENRFKELKTDESLELNFLQLSNQ